MAELTEEEVKKAAQDNIEKIAKTAAEKTAENKANEVVENPLRKKDLSLRRMQTKQPKKR